MATSEQETLLQRLRRFPSDRYPVQHATTQFHFGSVLLHSGDAPGAIRSLTAAVDGFQRVGMRLEQGKAAVMLGVGFRTAGRIEDATKAFLEAGELLAGLDQPADQAAAAYNLGLVSRESGDLEGAHAAWERARELFVSAGHPAQAGAAARDHGGSLMLAGNIDEALALLGQAVSLAEQGHDQPGTGAAANGLGLAHLAAGEPLAAVSALRRALAALPRSVRPADHAMVKANLALAHEQMGDWPRARLAARQALAEQRAPVPVRDQARQLLLRRPGSATEDLLAVLDTAEREEWVGVLREELGRAADLPGVEAREVVSGFLDGILARPETAYALVEALLQVLLELPPRTYQLLVSVLVSACAGRSQSDTERLRSVIASVMARFAIPQWQRLVATLNAASEELGEPATWR